MPTSNDSEAGPSRPQDMSTPTPATLWRQSLEAWETLEAASELEAPEAPMQPDQGALHSRPANLVEYALTSDGPDSDSGSDMAAVRRRVTGTFELYDHDQALRQDYFLRRQEISEIVRGDSSGSESDHIVFQQTVGTGYHPQ